MKTSLKQAMMTSISEVMETMFFLSFEFHEIHTLKSSSILDEPSLFIGRLHFSGPLTGFFFVMIPKRLLTILTTDFMGQDEDEIQKDHLDGTIMEITNMIAGNTFSTLDDQVSFHLGIPEIVTPGILSQTPVSDTSHFIQMETMDGIMAVFISLS